MSQKLLTKPVILRIIAALLLLMSALAGCNTAPSVPPTPDSSVVPVSGQALPSPVETAEPPPLPTLTNVTPQPSATPAPTLPLPTPPPLLPPPAAVTFPTDPTLTPNIAWGVQTSDTLTIWAGSYSDTPEPNISKAIPVARWDAPLKLLDIDVSPDHRSLAVLAQEEPTAEGIWPKWLSVIDLTNHKVQPIPDYGHYDLYEDYWFRTPIRIIGWLDNNKLSVQESNIPAAVVVATKDGTTYSRLPFPGEYSSAHETALAPDRNTFFSDVVQRGKGGFWLYNTDGGNLRKVMDREKTRPLHAPTWSPDGKYITFLSDEVLPDELKEGKRREYYGHMGVWVLDLNTGSQKKVDGADVWDASPVWSPDGSEIAFLRAKGPIKDEKIRHRYDRPENVSTDIYIADVISLKPRKLTSFSGKKNSGLQWVPGGNLILSSTADSQDGTPDLIAVSKKDGKITKIGKKSPGNSNEALVHPLVFK